MMTFPFALNVVIKVVNLDIDGQATADILIKKEIG